MSAARSKSDEIVDLLVDDFVLVPHEGGGDSTKTAPDTPPPSYTEASEHALARYEEPSRLAKRAIDLDRQTNVGSAAAAAGSIVMMEQASALYLQAAHLFASLLKTETSEATKQFVWQNCSQYFDRGNELQRLVGEVRSASTKTAASGDRDTPLPWEKQEAYANLRLKAAMSANRDRNNREALTYFRQAAELYQTTVQLARSQTRPDLLGAIEQRILPKYQKAKTFADQLDASLQSRFADPANQKTKASKKSAVCHSTLVATSSVPHTVGTLPVHWKHDAKIKDGFALVSMPKSSKEFKNVAAIFHSTVGQEWTVDQVTRCQNPVLWHAFTGKQRILDQSLSSGAAMKWAFHGTSENSISAICTDGFLRDFNQTSRWGRGTYFARDASYSMKYAAPAEDGTRLMLLSRILVGEPCLGSPDKSMPDRKPGGALHESMVDKLIDPSIWVLGTGTDHHAYPEYILTICRSQEQQP